MNRKICILFLLLAIFCGQGFCKEDKGPVPMHQNFPARRFENFRGKRKPLRKESCRLIRINVIPVTEDGKEFVALELFFNQSIDPRSVHNKNILVNSLALSPRHKILFNKSATCMRIVLERDDFFSLSVDGIRSYNASPVPKAQIESMECGHKYFFDKEEKLWKKF